MSQDAHDRLNRWQSEVDREIEKVMKKAQEEGLPGQGKPLKLDDDAHTPNEKRMAYKIMKDNDVLPEWIMMGKDLDKLRQKIETQAQRLIKDRDLGLAGARDDAVRRNVEAVYQRGVQRLDQQIAYYNDRVLTYNLKVPHGINHRQILRLQAILKSV